jgi:uncharacterized protein (TIGR02145 family)
VGVNSGTGLIQGTGGLTITGTVSLPANSITDAMVSDTLTASIFKGSGTTTDAVDLATAEVAGILGSTNGGSGISNAGTLTWGNGGTLGTNAYTSTAYLPSALTSAYIFVGNGSNVATGVAMSGDVTITNTGATTIGANTVALTTDTTGNYVAGITAGTAITITGTAGEAWSPMVAVTADSIGDTQLAFDTGQTLTTTGTPTFSSLTLTNDLTVANGGTGASTLTGVLKGNGTSAFTAMTGIANYVTRWTDANTLGTGTLYDNGASVGIGTTTLSGVKFKIANGGSSSVSDSYDDQSKIAGASDVAVASSKLQVSETTCGTYSVLDADGNTYNTVLVNGRCWLDRNLGATTVAASTLPSATTSYGYLFQWGRSRDGHQQTLYSNGANSATTDTLSSTDTVPDPDTAKFIKSPNTPWDWRSPQSPNAATLWAGANGGSNNPCPTGFRVPTQPEWSAVATAIGLTTANCGGTDCRVTAASSLLHLPPAGYRHYSSAALSSQGSGGNYWSSGPDGTNAFNLYFNSTSVNPADINYRAGGFSVRCVKD